MENYINYFAPTVDQILGLASLLLVSLLIAVIGGAIQGKNRPTEVDLIAGWGLVSLFFVLAGAIFNTDLRNIIIVLICLSALSCSYIIIRERRLIAGDVSRSLVIAFPLIWLAATMSISQWDELTQWVPNGRYLNDYHVFPGANNPPTTSVFPAYPHGLALIIYLTSQATGHLVENASGAFNIILLATFAIMVGRTIRLGITSANPNARVPLGLMALPPKQLGWVYCALGGLAVTGLNPTFVPKIVFTAYADTATSVLIGMSCFLLWYLLNTLSGVQKEFSAKQLSISFGLVSIALINVKQINLFFFFLIILAGFFIAIKDKNIRLKHFLNLLPYLIVPPISMYILWRLHIDINDVPGEFTFLPRSKWLMDHIFDIASLMLTIATKKGGYFVIMLVAFVVAVRGAFRIQTPIDRLSIIVATLFIGYMLFLLFAYVAIFGGGEGHRAASFWRYNMHLGGACVLFATYGIAIMWRRWIPGFLPRGLIWVVILCCIIGPVAFAHKIRFDLHPAKVFVRQVAEEAIPSLPPKARLAILDPTSNGEFTVIVRYVANFKVHIVGELTAGSAKTLKNVKTFLAQTKPDYIWLHVPTEATNSALDVKVTQGSSYLLKKKNNSWRVIKKWKYPGYSDPNNVKW